MTGPPTRALALLQAAHPLPALAVTGAAGALAAGAGQPASGVLKAVLMVLAGQASIGWSNDAWDWRRDAAAGRRDKPVARGAVGPRPVWLAAVGAAGLCVPLSLWYGVAAGLVHLVAVASAWAYNRWVKATAWSFAPYALSFGLLPVFVVLGLPGTPLPPWWAVAAGALLGVGAHLANALPDLADDLATGVRGAPHRLGPGATRWLATALLVAASVLLALAPDTTPGRLGSVGVLGALVVVGVLAVVGLAGRDRSRLPFHAAMAIGLVDVALLVARGGLLR